MAEIFPTPSAARDALIAAGWQPIDVGDACNIERGIVSAIVPVPVDSQADPAWTVALVTVGATADGTGYDLRGHVSGDKVDQWATTWGGSPLLHYVDAEIEVLDEDDPRAAHDRVHDGMPDDPFGETPASAAHATDAIELFAIMGAYEAAGFTRDEAFKLIEAIHQTELDHAAQHCLVHHQLQGEAEQGDQ